MLTHALRQRVDVRSLCSHSAVVSVTPLDDRSFLLSVDRPGWLGNLFSRIVRTERILSTERRYHAPPLVVEPVVLTEDHADLLEARFVLDRPLNDPSLLVLTWDGRSYQPIDLMLLPVGKEHELADTSDIFGSRP